MTHSLSRLMCSVQRQSHWLIYRFYRGNYVRSEAEHCCERSFPHASLTSVQIRIMARLRDRPPTYESNDTYDSRLQREHGESIQTISYAGLPRTDIRITAGGDHAPPCYEGGMLSVRLHRISSCWIVSNIFVLISGERATAIVSGRQQR